MHTLRLENSAIQKALHRTAISLRLFLYSFSFIPFDVNVSFLHSLSSLSLTSQSSWSFLFRYPRAHLSLHCFYNLCNTCVINLIGKMCVTLFHLLLPLISFISSSVPLSFISPSSLSLTSF